MVSCWLRLSRCGPEQFTRVARRWTADHQADGGEGDYKRMRARRRVWFINGDDAMAHVHAEFDPLTGQRIANRLTSYARRLHSADQQNLPKEQRRTLSQCLADALDDFTAGTASAGAAGSGAALGDVCVVAHVDNATGCLIGELPDGSRLPVSVLDELSCSANITGVVHDRCGRPIWRTSTDSDANITQRRILKAKWKGCFHCGASFAICQPHHIEPVSQGGRTRVANLVPACRACHTVDPPPRLAHTQAPRRQAHPAPTRTHPPPTRPRRRSTAGDR